MARRLDMWEDKYERIDEKWRTWRRPRRRAVPIRLAERQGRSHVDFIA